MVRKYGNVDELDLEWFLRLSWIVLRTPKSFRVQGYYPSPRTRTLKKEESISFDPRIVGLWHKGEYVYRRHFGLYSGPVFYLERNG
jgi:hypothetical protein